MRIIILLIFTFLICSTACAAPSVSNVTVTSSTYQITGTDFTTHADNNEGSFTWDSVSPICAKFKDFEDNLIESQGFEVENNYDSEWYMSTRASRTNSTYHGTRDYVASRLAMLLAPQSTLSTGYIHIVYYMQIYGSTVSNGKSSRWYFGDNSSVDNMYVALTSGEVTTMSESSGGTADYTGYTQPLNTWVRYDVFASNDDNTFNLLINGVSKITESDYFNNATFDPDGHHVQWGFIDDTDDSVWDFDDLFYDYTPARVELCNVSTWDTTTIKHCEIQIPTTWTTTSITVQINNGSFSSGDTAYLYVFDSAGAASSAKQVTIGSSSSDSPLSGNSQMSNIGTGNSSATFN